jgi:hypothetical protein
LFATCVLALPQASIGAPRQLERKVPNTPLWGFDSPSPSLGFPIPGSPLADVDVARTLGSSVIRLAIRWDHLQPEPGKFHATRARALDRVINRARKRGVGVLLTVVSTPCWATSAPPSLFEGFGDKCPDEFYRRPPRDPAFYEAFVKQLVNRWGRSLSGIEVWNEPNLSYFWRGTPEQHVGLAYAARAAVRASHYRKVPVIGGAIAGTDLGYLEQLLELGIGRATDAISIHPYALGVGYAEPQATQLDNSSFATAVPKTRELMDEYGDNDPIWITEFGYPDCPAVPYCVSAQQQASYLRKAAEMTAGWDYVDAFIVYRLRDWIRQDGSMNAHFGVLRRNRAPKPAAEALGNAFRRLSAESRRSGSR